MALIETVLLISILLYCLYRYTTVHRNFFVGRGVPFEKGYPIFGSFPSVFFKRQSFFEAIIQCSKKNRDQKVFGLFQGRDPFLVINDIELLKQVTVKDFEHFVNHKTFVDAEDDPLFGNALFGLKDQKWKDMRTTLSPAFTGSKMRMMFELIGECCHEAIKVLKTKSKNNPNGIELELKDFFTRYTNDVIATTAFGLKINSIGGENSEFYDMGKKATTFDTITTIKFMMLANFKYLTKVLKIKIQLFDKKVTDYFKRVVLDTMKARAANNIHRPDMINMLMEAQKTSTRQWSDVEIVAQCFFFFFAGFETTSVLMCFAAQELMENPDAQQKLYEEIQNIKNELNGKPLTYEALKGMKYMDMVVSETLRKWPPAQFTDRLCTKDFTLKSDNFEYEVKEGEQIGIPIPALHYNEEYYPNPKKFDPERFNDQNKHNINQFNYCPFGIGPRICIASRLALMESKAILYYMLDAFTFDVGQKSNIPLQLQAHPFQLVPTKGFWVKFTTRKS